MCITLFTRWKSKIRGQNTRVRRSDMIDEQNPFDVEHFHLMSHNPVQCSVSFKLHASPKKKRLFIASNRSNRLEIGHEGKVNHVFPACFFLQPLHDTLTLSQFNASEASHFHPISMLTRTVFFACRILDWTRRVNLEFWAQGDEEQRLSLYLGVHSVDSMDSPEKMGTIGLERCQMSPWSSFRWCFVGLALGDSNWILAMVLQDIQTRPLDFSQNTAFKVAN